MRFLHKFQSHLRQRTAEIFWRLRHAYQVVRKRFFLLSVKGHIELEPTFQFDASKATGRGKTAPDGKQYSFSHFLEWDEFPESVKNQVKNYDSILRMFLGDGYYITTGQVWRNTSIPEEFQNLELFNQHWHYDKVVDFRNAQLFILLSDVTEKDGPFQYSVNPSEYKLVSSVLERSNEDLEFETKKLVGKRGDTLLFATGSMPHRATIPAPGRHRDIFSVAFMPAYTGIGISSKSLFS